MQPPNNQFVDELVRQLRYCNGILVAPGIPQKKVNNALAKNNFAGTEMILGLIDCTVFGSAKDHLMFTTGGIWWNHLSSKPRTGSIAYAEFKVATSSLLDSYLELAQARAIILAFKVQRCRKKMQSTCSIQ